MYAFWIPFLWTDDLGTIVFRTTHENTTYDIRLWAIGMSDETLQIGWLNNKLVYVLVNFQIRSSTTQFVYLKPMMLFLFLTIFTTLTLGKVSHVCLLKEHNKIIISNSSLFNISEKYIWNSDKNIAIRIHTLWWKYQNGLFF